MKSDLGLNLRQIGDIFMFAVRKTADIAIEVTDAVVSNSDIKPVHYNMKKAPRKIIRRVSGVIKGKNILQRAADSAVKCSKYVVRKYDVTMLKYRRRRIAGEIVERVTSLINSGSAVVGCDGVLSGLVDRLNRVEKNLMGHRKQKTRPVGPVTAVITKLGASIFGAARK